MKSSTIQSVRGMNDILPDDARLWEYFEDTVRAWLHAYGYRPLRTPILERTELFARSIGAATDIVEKEMYTFVDQLNQESLTLRPEGTASCVRAAVEHGLLHGGAQRLCYWGPMFRHERPQKGRYRQFHQVGVEALGYAGPDIDVEHILMCDRLWRKLALDGITLELNSLGSAEARARYRERLIAFLERHRDALDEDSRRRLRTNPLRVLDSKHPQMQQLIGEAPQMSDDLDEASLLHFEALQASLQAAGVSYRINPRLVRGLDYYNGTVCEWMTDRLGAQGTVCAGGRYDGLVEQIGGKPTPACGFAMGVERLLALLRNETSSARQRVPDAYLVHQGELAGQFAQSAAERLRDADLAVLLHCGGGSFKSQMRRADASGARFAIIIGDDEAKAGAVSLKPLREPGEQMRASVVEAVNIIRDGVTRDR